MVRTILDSKPTLFSATACSVIAILAVPVIIPNMLHGDHLMHVIIHIAGLTLATFLTTLAVSSHRRTKSRRMLISFLAFGCFAASEFIQLIGSAWSFPASIDPLLQIVCHLLVFSTLGLLALAVFLND